MPVKLYEGDKNETGGTGIEVTPNKVINLILRSLNNLIKVNDNNEVYTDLQLEDGIADDDTLPIGVNVGRVLQADGRPVTGTLISGQTTSGDRVKVLYGDDGKIRVDNGTGEWNILAYEYEAGPGIYLGEYNDYSAMQGPCPDGFHIPTRDELGIVFSLSITAAGYLYLPTAGYLNYTDGQLNSDGYSYIRSCNSANTNVSAYSYRWTGNGILSEPKLKGYGFNIRAFKDIPVEPTGSGWINTFSGIMNEEVYRNQSLGLISVIKGDNLITIQDKNIGATTVWHTGDAIDENNSGYFFQWGNNYGFSLNGAVNTSSTTVLAAGYGPNNPYNNDTFIMEICRYSDINNDLRGGVTGILTIDNAVVNTGVLSVNGEIGHVITKQPNVCEITVQLVDTDYIGTATKVGDLVDGATIIGHSNGLQGLQGLSIAGVSYTVINGIDALDNWTHFYGIYREGYGVIIYSFNNN